MSELIRVLVAPELKVIPRLSPACPVLPEVMVPTVVPPTLTVLPAFIPLVRDTVPEVLIDRSSLVEAEPTATVRLPPL